MQFAKQILSSISKKPSLYLFIFLIIFSVDRYNRWVNFEKNNFPFVDDVDQFYSYLPAAFIQHDLTFSFPNNYWTVKGKTGNNIPRPTYGMAIMYSPFFFIGHTIAKVNGYNADGYSLPYKWAIHFGSFFYALIGLWFCRKNLLKFFSEFVTLITLICVFLGTNLFYYTYAWGEMSHSYLFFVLSLFIYYVIKWHDSKAPIHFYVFSFLLGFATLIRPTDFLAVTFPLLIGVTNLKELKLRISQFISLKAKLIPGILLFIFPVLLQMIYWKVYAGSWIVHTYPEKEKFFFLDPKITNFLFSFRKGWFVYTPIMLFGILGIFLLKERAKNLFLFLVVYFVANVYILSSWWDWGFGGSFGCRAIIQQYAFFIFGLAAFIAFVFHFFQSNRILNYTVKGLTILVFLFLIRLNLDQSWKYKYGLIHYNGMTKEAYFFMFNKKEITPEDTIKFNKLIKKPNFEAMLNGKRD